MVSDRVVDELNPEKQMSRKQVDVLLQYEDQDLPTVDTEAIDVNDEDVMLHTVLKQHHGWLTKVKDII